MLPPTESKEQVEYLLRKDWNSWLEMMLMHTIWYGMPCASTQEERVYVIILYYRGYWSKTKEKRQYLGEARNLGLYNMQY